jgi:peroxiredoxin family protein
MNDDEKFPVKKINIICAKGSLEDVYAALILGNGAVMEGIKTNLFFTFFGVEAITRKRLDILHTSAVGNPALRIPGGIRLPTLLGVIPGMEALISEMMKNQLAKLDIPPVIEFLGMITSGGGKIYACKLGMDMFRVKREELCEHVSDVLTVGEFYALAGGDGSQIIFI